ncbi:MAG: peptidylprolyl isomerase [Bacteroidetes bacterium]|nr:peptidylprolyl isomerase [Bacteroidota bacterium]MBL7006706.1 peptidylprolyl isomerase [Spirochaetia bacterium]
MPPKKISNINEISKTKETQPPKKSKIKLSVILSIIMLVFVVIAFGLSPIAGAFGGSSSDLVFGYYNEEPITFTYNNYFYNQRESIAQNWDVNADDSNYEYQVYQIWKQAYDNTVIHIALMQEADKSGLLITDNAIDRYLLESGPYINSEGKFDPQLYNSVSDVTKKNIRDEVKESILTQTLINDLFGSYISPAELEFIDAMGKNEKEFDYLVFPLTTYPEEKTKAYGESNAIEFTTIEVSIITLSGENKQEAESIYNRIKNNEILFEDAARTYSLDTYADKGGEVGANYFFAMRENFNSEEDLNSVFSLKEGEISSLLETPYGYNIYQVNKTPELPDFTNEETLSIVKEYLIARERGLVEDYINAEVSNLISLHEDLPSVASEAGLDIFSTSATPINYGGSLFLGSFQYSDTEQYLANLENNESSLSKLFATEKGSFSEPIKINEGVLVAFCKADLVNEGNLETLSMIYPYIAPQVQQSDFTNSIFTSEKFEDNFLQIFFSEILATS